MSVPFRSNFSTLGLTSTLVCTLLWYDVWNQKLSGNAVYAFNLTLCFYLALLCCEFFS